MKLIIHAALLATGLLLTTRQVSAAEPVKVGIIMSTTGAYSFVGIPLANGIKLASEELVARKGAGDPEISWIFEDNRSDKQEFTVLMNRMVRADDVRLVIGPVSSYEALAASPVAVELQVPMFTTATSPETLMAGPYVFKSTENGPDIIAPLARYVADRLKPKSCYLVHIRDNNAYLIYSDIMRDVLQKAGIGIAAQDTVLTSESDFTALATKIVQSGADCLYLATPPEIGANIVVQSRQAGLPGSTVLVGNQNMNSPSYIKTGGSAVDGTYLAAEFDATSTSPLTKDFVTRYRAKYKTPPPR